MSSDQNDTFNEGTGQNNGNTSEQSKTQERLLQIVKACGYALIFLVAQIIANFVLQTIWGVQRVSQLSSQGIMISEGELTDYLLQKTYENTHMIVIIYVPIMLAFLLVFFGIRRKNILKEIQMKKFSVRYILLVVILFVGFALFANAALNLLPVSLGEDYRQSASRFIGQHDLLLMIVANIFLAPLSEEIIFRGLITSRLRRAFPNWVSIAIASILFGIVHLQIVWAVYAALMGVIMGIIAYKADSIAASILFHVLFNTFGTILSYVGFVIPFIGIIIAFVIGLIITIVGLYFLLKQPKTE